MKLPPCVLTIAGSDSGGGAGVQADARVIAGGGGYALFAVTAVTAQNLHGVQRWEAVGAEMIAAQVDAVWEDFTVAAVKTGLLPGADAVRAVARVLGRRRLRVPVVVDPVLGSTSGTRFLDAAGVDALKRDLRPLAALVTPNWPEAEALTGLPVRSAAEAAAAGQRLVAEGWRAALVKGGHGGGARVIDVLVTADGRERWFESKRVATRNLHGTGCALSAGIAVNLALGAPLPKAIQRARRALLAALRKNRKKKWPGRGPAV